MKNRIFQLSIVLNLMTLTFVVGTLFLNSEHSMRLTYEKHADKTMQAYLNTLEKRQGALTLSQKYNVRDFILACSKMSPKLCSVVYSDMSPQPQSQGERNVSSEQK